MMGSSGILWVYGKGELGVACAVEQDVEDLVEMVGSEAQSGCMENLVL